MKIQTLHIVFILLALCLYNCSDDDIEDPLKNLRGSYNITSAISNIPVDLNDDGVSSVDLVNEINAFGNSDLEIRPYSSTDSITPFIKFYIPASYVVSEDFLWISTYTNFLRVSYTTEHEFNSSSFMLDDTELWS